MAEKILIIDDDKAISSALRALFTNEGYDVDIANSGVETLDKISKKQYDLAMLDVLMPGMNGLEVLPKLKEKSPNTIVVMLTAQQEARTAVEALKAGAADYINKPFDNKDIVSKIKEILVKEKASLTKRFSGQPQIKNYNGKIISVLSFKGGVGKTSLAVNLAIALSQENKQVILFDEDYQYGDVDLLLNLRRERYIIDLFTPEGSLNEEKLNSFLIDYSPNLKLLTSIPIDVSDEERIKPSDISVLLDSGRVLSEYFVIDLRSHLNDKFQTYLDYSDAIIIVLTPNISSIRKTNQGYEKLKNFYIPQEKLKLVSIETSSHTEITPAEIKKHIFEVTETISNDDITIDQAIDSGKPFMQEKPQIKVSQEIKRLSKTILKIN